MGYGQGSIHPDKRNPKRWVARYYGPDGRQRSKSFGRKVDATAFLSKMQTEKLRGQWIDPRGAQVRFGEWAREWFAGKHTLGEHAWDRDEGLLRIHVIPPFEHMAIGRINPLDIRSWTNDLVAKGLSPHTIRPCVRIMSAIMRAAVAAKLIAESPVLHDIIDLPPLERKRERFLTETEVERLAESIEPHYRLIVLMAAYTGCRWQELAGLKRIYLDLDGGRLHIRGVLKRVKGDVVFREKPKTDASRRTIGLPPFLVEMLKEHIAQQPLGEWVFTGPRGGILRDSNFKRPWAKAVAEANLSPLTFHDLRHTHAAWLVRDGIQPLALQHRLGHKSIKTTMDVYGHLFPNHDLALVEQLDRRRAAAHAEPETAKIVSLRQ